MIDTDQTKGLTGSELCSDPAASEPCPNPMPCPDHPMASEPFTTAATRDEVYEWYEGGRLTSRVECDWRVAQAVREFAEWLEKIAEHDPDEMSMLHYPSMANRYLADQLDK